MSANRKHATFGIVAGLVLLAVGIVGYKVEGANAQERPDGVGYGMPWSHELHARHPDFSCQSCHHKSRAGQTDMQACGICHPTSPDMGQPQPPPSKASDRRTALHASCVGCHKAVEQGPVQCADCHEPGHGTASCATCHESDFTELAGGGHAGVACETCHSALARRLENDRHITKVPSAGAPAQCLSCHGREEPDAAGLPTKNFRENCPAANRVDENNERQCLECHAAHAPRAKRHRATGHPRVRRIRR